MKKILSFIMTLALIGSMSVLAFADGTSVNPNDNATSPVVETPYIPRNAEPVSTVSGVPVDGIETYAVKKCTECGSPTRAVLEGHWELAPCGHWAFWDGSVCTNPKWEMPFVDRVYLRCNCH